MDQLEECYGSLTFKKQECEEGRIILPGQRDLIRWEFHQIGSLVESFPKVEEGWEVFGPTGFVECFAFKTGSWDEHKLGDYGLGYTSLLWSKGGVNEFWWKIFSFDREGLSRYLIYLNSINITKELVYGYLTRDSTKFIGIKSLPIG